MVAEQQGRCSLCLLVRNVDFAPYREVEVNNVLAACVAVVFVIDFLPFHAKLMKAVNVMRVFDDFCN